jgi:hypothetical protein
MWARTILTTIISRIIGSPRQNVRTSVSMLFADARSCYEVVWRITIFASYVSF